MPPLSPPKFVMISVAVLCLAAVKPVRAAPPPLYNNITPAPSEKRPAPTASSPDIVLNSDTGAAPATTVKEANDRFFARAAEAVRYTIHQRDRLLRRSNKPEVPVALHRTKGGYYNEQDFGFTILAMMAYRDYFNDDSIGRDFLREEAEALLAKERAGTPGTSPPDNAVLKWQGEYDVLLQSYTTLYYKYYAVLSQDSREKLFNELLSVKGQHPGLYQGIYRFIGLHVATVTPVVIHIPIFGYVVTPETENHELMIETARYLTNQLLYQEEVANAAAEGRPPNHDHYDNNRNGTDEKRPLVDFILLKLQDILKNDFIEYNSRPYQDYTMVALLNLASYAYDDRVRLAARMVLDYVSAKVAVSSSNLVRSPPFRRRNEESSYGPVKSVLGHSYLARPLVDIDPQTCFYSMLAGNTSVWNEHAVSNTIACDMVNAGIRDYRVPHSILDLFVTPSHRRFYQRFHHSARTIGEDTGQYADEAYAGSPNYLLSAGGNPTYYAYVQVLPFPFRNPGDDADCGVAMPTTFLPDSMVCWGMEQRTLEHIIQFGQFGQFITDVEIFGKTFGHGTRNMGVAPDFACGDMTYVPGRYNIPQDTLHWSFVEDWGYFLAIYGNNWSFSGRAGFFDGGFMEVLDTSLNPGVTLEEFKREVLRKNGETQWQIPGENTYETYTGQRVRFQIGPGGCDIISTSGVPEVQLDENWTTKFAWGTILNSEQGSGLITITNPHLGTRITLDMHDQDRDGDPLYGVHHPRRISESGEIQSAGANEEVWLNVNYTGPGEGGDFGDPFKTLRKAMDKVAEAGTIRIVSSSLVEPTLIKKKMKLTSMGGATTISRR